MKPIKATYTPQKVEPLKVEGVEYLPWEDDTDNARVVLIVAFHEDTAVFIDADNTLKRDIFALFTDCQLQEE